MTQDKGHTRDLEKRTLKFALDVRLFVRSLPKTIIAQEDSKQLVRSSGSVGANYIEACEALSRKDFAMRMKICRKEAKESRYWLMMFDTLSGPSLRTRDALIQEATELLKICSAILTKV